MDKAKMKVVMDEFKSGDLHSGSSHGPTVTNPKQAIAIGLKQAGAPPRMTENAHDTHMPVKKHPQHSMGYTSK